jgi:hypothetical protein
MHTPHIKPQNLGIPYGYQPRKVKPQSVEAELVTPVSEWERGGNKRNRAFAVRDCGKDDEQEQPAFEQTAHQVDETAGGETGEASVQVEDDGAFFRLLGAASGAGAVAPAKERATDRQEAASLRDLLSEIAKAAKSAG